MSETLKNPISVKIGQSISLYGRITELIENNDEAKWLIQELNNLVDESESIRQMIGMAKECEDCSMSGSGCCGKDMENHYGVEILIINLLMGVNLFKGGHNKDSCYFVGEGGCILRVREVICVNYLCNRIYSRIPLKNIILFQEVSGRGLDTLFYLEEKIKNYILCKIPENAVSHEEK